MDYASFEVGELPINDPTLEEGAVMVKRSLMLNQLVEHHRQQVALEEPDLVPAAVEDKARISVIAALHDMATNSMGKPMDGNDIPAVMTRRIIVDLYRDIPYTGQHVQVFLAILPYNTMVVIYNYVEGGEVVH